MYKLLITAGACIGLAACASVPQPLSGQFQDVPLQNAAQANGSQVRWGGEIVDTIPGSDQTCIYALSRPLDRQARPRHNQESMGRFVACHPGFYDPEIFAKGRDITVTGTLDGSITRKVGDYDYVYPRVAADAVYLWPLVQPLPAYPYRSSYWYDPFWGPAYMDPFWYRPAPIIVVPRAAPPKASSGK